MFQANEIKNVICKIIINTKENKQKKEVNNYKYSYFVFNHIMLQLNGFALQMFHETLEITAGGFFTIDFSLIFAVRLSE